MNFYKITALLASIFSVIFSLSIVKELQQFVHPIVFVFVAIFLILFVVYNEISKVRELQKYYKKLTYSKLAIGSTFIISFFLSGIGIYFFTNNTIDVEISLNNDLKQKELSIEQSYQFTLDSLNNVAITSPEHSKAIEDINFWRERKSDSKEQRQEILSNIHKLELKRDNLYNTLEKQRKSQISTLLALKSNELDLLFTQNDGQTKNMNKNNFISFVFVIMVIATEFIILNVQRQISNFYTKEQSMIIKIVKDCEYRNLEKIDINEFKFSIFNKYKDKFTAHIHTDAEWEETKKAHNLLKELKIIKGFDGDIISKNSSKFLIQYFNKLNKL